MGQRKTIVQLKNPTSSIKLARSKPKIHSLSSGPLSHVQEYRELLQKRSDVIEAAVREEFEQFENMENIEKLVEKRNQKQAKKDQAEQEMYYNRGLMARKSGIAYLKQKNSNEKERKSQTITSIKEVASDCDSNYGSRAVSEAE